MSFFSFFQSNARWLMGGFLLTFFSSFGQTFFIALSAGEIRSEYGLSHGDFGGLYMMATLASALTLPFLGRIVDFLSVSKTVLICVPALACACLFMGWSQSLILMVATIYFLRLFGQGMLTHISLTAMGRWYDAQRGRAVSIAVLGFQAGEALFPIIFVALLWNFGWRETWFMAGAVLVFFALPLIYYLMRVERVPQSQKTDDKDKTHQIRNWTRAEVLKDKIFWLLILGVLAPSFIGTTIFFHQIYLIELKGWGTAQFAAAFMIKAIMTLIFALVSGYLIDRFSAVALLPTFLLPLAAACFALFFMTSNSTIYVFMGFVGISYGISSTLFGALWPEVYGTKHLGSVRSLIIAMMVFATALGPGLTGYLIDLGIDYPLQIAVMGFYCIAISLLMLFVSRKIISRNENGNLV